MRKARAATRGISALILLLALGAAPRAASARDEPPDSNGYTGMVGMGSAIGTLVYAPLKLAYAVTGGVTGGLVWVLTGGNSEVAAHVVRNAVRGDYVISPAHLEGEEKLRFRGDRR